MGKELRIPEHLKPWIEAHRRFRLSHMHIQMARELGMNPKRFGKLDNHRQEPWKAPLPIFIERIYFKRFGKERPDEVLTIRQFAERQQAKKRAKKLAKLAGKSGETTRGFACFVQPARCRDRAGASQPTATRRISSLTSSASSSLPTAPITRSASPAR